MSEEASSVMDETSLEKEVQAFSEAVSTVSTYPPEVEEALSTLLSTSDIELDPLDAADFDPIEYINREFPDESSLATKFDSFVAGLNTKANQAEQRMYTAIREQAANSKKAEDHVQESKKSIRLLYSKIHEIRSKAEQSEKMVQEICKDIKKLDLAKKNLTLTITSLKRLHMFVTAVDQLEYMTEKRQYKQVANLLQAIEQLDIFFKDYDSVPKVNELRSVVSNRRDCLRSQIFNDFKNISEISADYYSMEEMGKGDEAERNVSLYYSPSQTPEALAGACYVIDALGTDVRRELIKNLCSIWLKPYERIFGPGSSDGQLQSTKRRYIWFLRLLKEHEEKYSEIFPKFWMIQYHFAVGFCQKTSQHLKQELSKIDPPDLESIDVGELMRALRSTLDFEEELTMRFQSMLHPEERETEVNGESPTVSREAIKARHRERLESQGSLASSGIEAPIDLNASEVALLEQEAKNDALNLPEIARSISSVFEPYLVAYVKRESEGIQEQLQKVLAEERVDQNGALPVLSSSLNLFLYIKNSINRCTKFTTGQAFYDLHREFKSCLRKYSKDLNGKLPNDYLPPGRGKSTSLSKKKQFKIEDATTACFVLNSAEYCADTVSQLEDMIKTRIDEAYEESISLEAEQDLFFTNISTAIHVLIEGIKSRLKVELQSMQDMNWVNFEDVGDQSEYLSNIIGLVKEFFKQIQDLLSEIYFRTFCDKFVFAFLPLYIQSIIDCKQIGEYGAQQLLLDTRALKTILLNITIQEDSMAFETFKKYVSHELEKCEVLLKLVSMSKNTKISMLLENFQLLWKDGTITDLETVLDLRGVKKADQSTILATARKKGVAEIGEKPKNALSESKNVDESKTEKSSKFDFFTSVKGFSADMSSVIESTSTTFQSSYKRAVTKSNK